MFSFGPAPPPPLHSLILRSILQHLHHGYGIPVPSRPIAGFPPVLQPPVQVNPASGPLGSPTLGSGPNQHGQPVPGPGPLDHPTLQPPAQVPGVIAPDPYGGGGSGPPRGLVHSVLSGLL